MGVNPGGTVDNAQRGPNGEIINRNGPDVSYAQQSPPPPAATPRVAIPDANAPTPTRLAAPAAAAPQTSGFNYANPYQGANPYDQQRKLAVDAAQGAGAQGLDAITRRYAAMGNLNSGAYTQALSDNTRGTQAATESAMSGINSQENQMSAAAQEAEKARTQQESQYGRSVGQQESQFSRELAMGQNQQSMDQWANEINANTAKSQSGGGGGCCFIFLEARYGNGAMDKVVRKYRDEYMTIQNQRGYYKLAEVLVPLMRKSKLAKFVVRTLLTDPLVSYGKWYYGAGGLGWIFSPIKTFWMKTFNYLGGNHEFIRENGELV